MLFIYFQDLRMWQVPKSGKTIDCSEGVEAEKGKYILILMQNYTVANNSVKSH